MLLPNAASASFSRTLPGVVSLSGLSAAPLPASHFVPDAALSSALSFPLVLLRGGELFAKQTTHLDISRVRMRLEGLQAYGTLCALLANGCLRLYSAVQERDAKGSKSKKLALDLFLIAVVVSILSGSYTTVVFTLLPLFSKTALGRGYDGAFLEFWAHTAHIRETGFSAFLCSLGAFETAFVLSLYLRTTGRRQKILVALAAVLVALSMGEWMGVMRLAAKYLFPLRAEVEY